VRLLVGFITVSLALNLPLALVNVHGWSYFLTWQAHRDINPDSIWAHVPGIHVGVVNLWFAQLFLLGLLWITLQTWWGGALGGMRGGGGRSAGGEVRVGVVLGRICWGERAGGRGGGPGWAGSVSGTRGSRGGRGRCR